MKKSFELHPKAHLYCEANNRAIVKLLGDGITESTEVFGKQMPIQPSRFRKISPTTSENVTAISDYENIGFFWLLDLMCPQLIGYDDSLHAVEMTIVKPPFLLDFGKAYLDEPAPNYGDAEVMQDWRDKNLEDWEDLWPAVRKAFYALQKYGIYHYDLNRKNVQVAT
jgi:hypothetical protein